MVVKASAVEVGVFFCCKGKGSAEPLRVSAPLLHVACCAAAACCVVVGLLYLSLRLAFVALSFLLEL